MPVAAPRTDGLVDARQLDERMRRELEHFFIMATGLSDKEAEVIGWAGPEEADQLIERGIAVDH